MPYVDAVEKFQVEVLGMTGTGITEDIMRRVIREAIEKWDQWNIDQWKRSSVC